MSSSQYGQLAPGTLRQGCKLLRRAGIAACGKDLPSAGGVLACEFETNSAIGTRDQDRWHLRCRRLTFVEWSLHDCGDDRIDGLRDTLLRWRIL